MEAIRCKGVRAVVPANRNARHHDFFVNFPEPTEQESSANALVQPEPVYHTVSVIFPLVVVQLAVPAATVQLPENQVPSFEAQAALSVLTSVLAMSE